MFNSVSVNNFPSNILYNGFFIVWTILSTTPLCDGECSGLWYHFIWNLSANALCVLEVFSFWYRSLIWFFARMISAALSDMMIFGMLLLFAILLMLRRNDSVVLSCNSSRCTALDAWQTYRHMYTFLVSHFPLELFPFNFFWQSEHFISFLHVPHFFIIIGPAKSNDIASKLPGVILLIGKFAICCWIFPSFGNLHSLFWHNFIVFRICCLPPVIQYLSLVFLRVISGPACPAIWCWFIIMKFVISAFFGNMTGFFIWCGILYKFSSLLFMMILPFSNLGLSFFSVEFSGIDSFFTSASYSFANSTFWASFMW